MKPAEGRPPKAGRWTIFLAGGAVLVVTGISVLVVARSREPSVSPDAAGSSASTLDATSSPTDSPSPTPTVDTSGAEVNPGFCADAYCLSVNCQAGAGGGDDFFGQWGAHKFGMVFQRDLKGSYTLGIEYTPDGGELREAAEFTLELSQDRNTLYATVVAIAGAIYYNDGRPPQSKPVSSDGLAVGDIVEFRVCRPHLLEATDVRTSGTYGFGFAYVCQAGVERWVCGA